MRLVGPRQIRLDLRRTMGKAFQQPAWWVGILASAGALLACTHAVPPSERRPSDNAALEAQARRDLGPDPFRELDAGAAPIAAAAKPNVIEPAPEPDPRAEADAAIQAALHSTDCAAHLATVAANSRASPRALRDGLAAAERCQERARDLRGARRTARKLLLTCGPDGLAGCRARTLALWRRLAARSPKDAALATLAKETASKDSCLNAAEAVARGEKPLDGCLAPAEALYRSEGDALMRARAKLARARHAVRLNDPRAERLLADAADACQEPRCEAVQNQALAAYATWAAAQHRPETVLQLRLRQDALAAQALPPGRRRYARSAQVDAACAALDEAEGSGSCRALERRVTGTWTFHDWSTRDFPGELPKESILRANDDYAPTLQDCFRDQATRLPVPSSVRYHVRWMVTLDGRADQVHIDPPGDDAGPLAGCLRTRFAAWRYPRSHGENQHVEQSFTVTAKAR